MLTEHFLVLIVLTSRNTSSTLDKFTDTFVWLSFLQARPTKVPSGMASSPRCGSEERLARCGAVRHTTPTRTCQRAKHRFGQGCEYREASVDCKAGMSKSDRGTWLFIGDNTSLRMAICEESFRCYGRGLDWKAGLARDRCHRQRDINMGGVYKMDKASSRQSISSKTYSADHQSDRRQLKTTTPSLQTKIQHIYSASTLTTQPHTRQS